MKILWKCLAISYISYARSKDADFVKQALRKWFEATSPISQKAAKEIFETLTAAYDHNNESYAEILFENPYVPQNFNTASDLELQKAQAWYEIASGKIQQEIMKKTGSKIGATATDINRYDAIIKDRKAKLAIMQSSINLLKTTLEQRKAQSKKMNQLENLLLGTDQLLQTDENAIVAGAAELACLAGAGSGVAEKNSTLLTPQPNRVSKRRSEDSATGREKRSASDLEGSVNASGAGSAYDNAALPVCSSGDLNSQHVSLSQSAPKGVAKPTRQRRNAVSGYKQALREEEQ
jgi:hypothetical protein